MEKLIDQKLYELYSPNVVEVAVAVEVDIIHGPGWPPGLTHWPIISKLQLPASGHLLFWQQMRLSDISKMIISDKTDVFVVVDVLNWELVEVAVVVTVGEVVLVWMDVKIFVADVVSEIVDVVKLVAVDVLVALETSVDVVEVMVCEMEVFGKVVLERDVDVKVEVTVKVVE